VPDIRWYEYLFRFFMGRHLRRDRRTNCTFRSRGTKPLDPKDRPPPFFEYWPEWYRLAYRLAAIALAIGWVFYGLIPTVSFSGCCAALVVGTKSRKLYDAARVDNKVVRPLWKGLIAMGVFDQHAKHSDFLSLPRDYGRDKNTVITLRFPDHFESSDQEKTRITRFVSRKLGGNWDAKWTDKGTTILRLTHTPEPPARFPFSQALRIIRTLDEGQLFVGLGERGQPIIVDMDKETPHVAISAGTGAGKSSLIALIIIQILAWGAQIFAIDPKRVSFNPVRHLPNIQIIRNVADQWDAIAMVRAEMDRRYEILDQDENATFPRWVLILEEQNAFYTDSTDYWEVIRQRGEPARPRVYRDISAILNKGRQAHVNVISIYQRASANVCGGGDVRSQYGYFLLGRYKKAEWKMFVDIWPWIAPSKVPGRFTYYDGDEYGKVQAAYPFMPDVKVPTLLEEATDYVTSRVSTSGNAAVLVPAQRDSDGTTEANAATPLRDLTLREAHDQGIVTGNFESIQRASRRNNFPKPSDTSGVSHRYSVADLVAWEANRTSTKVGTPS
jgi:DNA translocase FtsK/SpoIIIE-like protein